MALGLAALGLAALLSGGCAAAPDEGYVLGDAHDRSIRSVRVPLFENETFDHGLEMRLTEALIKEIERSTPWNVSTDAAATSLTGSIRTSNLATLSTNRDSGLVQELAVEIAVDFEWRDNRTGRTLLARRDFRSAGTFVPAFGVQERLATGQQAAIEALARDIVAELRSDW